jgi:hypothetical protein
MKGREIKSVGIMGLVFTCFLATTHISTVSSVARDFDVNYIERECRAFLPEVAGEFSAHIYSDHSISGTQYIFEEVPGEMSQGDAEVATRHILTEGFCLYTLGCAVPPTLLGPCVTGRG